MGAIACSSGMSAGYPGSAEYSSVRREVIAGSGLFGGTLDLLHDLEAFGIIVKFIPRVEKALLEPLISEKPKWYSERLSVIRD